LCGFRIAVIQVFKFVVYRNIFSSFEQTSHNLEITFTDFKDFNNKFTKLGSLHMEAKKISFTTNNISNESANKNSGIIDIKRSVIKYHL
jgi:hypothetical protein